MRRPRRSRFPSRADLSWNTPRGTLRFAPYYRYTENDWGQITRLDSAGVLTTTWENVASMQSYGAQLSAMMRSAGRLSGNVSIGGHREVRDASNLAQEFSGAYFRYNANANLTVAIGRTLNLQGMLCYSSPQELPQGRRSAFVMSSVGMRKRLFDNQATVNLRIDSPPVTSPCAAFASGSPPDSGRCCRACAGAGWGAALRVRRPAFGKAGRR